MLRSRRIASVVLAVGALACLETGAASPANARRSSTAAPAPAASASEAVDLAMVTAIRDEGFHRSQVMATAAYLADRIGARLTGTPALKDANEWTRRQLADFGLANAHLESWQFGHGWSFSRSVVTLVGPHAAQLAALPKAWTPGTQGEVRGEAVRLALDAPDLTAADLEKYKGTLAGKIVLLDKPVDLAAAAAVPPRRFTAETLATYGDFPIDAARVSDAERQTRRDRGRRRTAMIRKFLFDEKVLASIEASPLPWGTLRVTGGGPYKDGEQAAVTGLVMAAEPYNRLVRLLDAGQKVQLAIDVAARTYDDDPRAYNTIAEIPGSDPGGEIVMAGAHLDSWHAGTGATDNDAGCAVVMEAARILAALHVKPRRTIRVALWTGEEEGLLGSTAYVEQHFAARPPAPPAAPAAAGTVALPPQQPDGPLTFKAEYGKLSAYFNIDNGSGKVRGINTQENAAVTPIFTAWLAPLADLGATTVSQRSVGSTDHVPFDRAGLPAYQFIQDELDYFAHTHHTDTDVYDHLDANDMMQSAVVLASFLYDAANRPDRLPRKPLPASATARPASAPAKPVKTAAP